MTLIEIDPEAGFCFGVQQVIHTAEALLEKEGSLYSLGEVVHNKGEMKRLHEMGLKTLTHREMEELKPSRILIRAHGEPPSTYRLAAEHHIQVIDGTCPIVLKLQERIRRKYLSMNHEEEQVVIFGKPGHPETVGLLGQVNGDATVVSHPEEAGKVDPNRRVHLFSQTTMDPSQFAELEQVLKLRQAGPAGSSFRSSCTICGQMKRRKPGLRKFALKHDVMLFVSGKDSANGRMLFEYCLTVNPRTFWISDEQEVDPHWFEGARSVGISGATSTSREQLETVGTQLKKIISS
jgi:4-hydroxy-3-methylbut-2-enyl diphosphate reductase